MTNSAQLMNPPPLAAPAKRPRILYVDDDDGNLSVFEALFMAYYNITTTDSAQEALTLMARQPFDVVLSDQRMPGMTGIEFLKEVMARYPEVIRIIVTAYSDIDIVVKAINECQIFRYVTKPWDKNELRQTLDNALDVRRLRAENQALVASLQDVNQQLAHKLEEMEALNREIASYTLRVVQQNERFRDVRATLSDIGAALDQQRQSLQQVVQSISTHLRQDKGWDDFMLVFEKVHVNFFLQLKARYPDLTANELRLCALIKLNLGAKDIAAMLNISPRSVNMSRYRLRKKLNLNEDQDLHTFLNSL